MKAYRAVGFDHIFTLTLLLSLCGCAVASMDAYRHQRALALTISVNRSSVSIGERVPVVITIINTASYKVRFGLVQRFGSCLIRDNFYDLEFSPGNPSHDPYYYVLKPHQEMSIDAHFDVHPTNAQLLFVRAGIRPDPTLCVEHYHYYRVVSEFVIIPIKNAQRIQ